MKLIHTSIMCSIDPHFQRLLSRKQRGLSCPPTSSTDVDEVAVFARVRDVKTWESLSEVKVGAIIGKLKDSTLVTARIPASRIEQIRNHKTVISLKPARKLRPALSSTTRETKIDELQACEGGKGGQDVVVGIVDFGCDFAHRNFRNADRSTRIEAIWDQSATASPSSPFGYGRVYESAQINLALDQSDPYQSLGYGPNPLISDGTHGTHVMDIAAGNGRGSGVAGTAPNASIIFVQPATSDIPWSGPSVVGSDFGDSVQLLEAIEYIFERAGDRPCVINLSLGTNGGPHDGSNLVEMGIDVLLQEKNRAVVIAASNSFADGIHFEGHVTTQQAADLNWSINSSDFTGNELEVWYSSLDEFELELIAPSGQSLGRVGLGKNAELRDDDGEILLFVSHRQGDPNNGDNTIGLFMETSLPAGNWIVRLHGKSIDNGSFHSWIERDDRGQSNFDGADDGSYTLGSLSTGQSSIVVGSYDAHKESLPISWFSSAGPTRDGREKPEISAPGHAVMAAKSRSIEGVVTKSGTSMSAPAVSGIIARIFSEARTRGMDISVGHLREMMLSTARSEGGWDSRFGSGRIDASSLLDAIVDKDT